MALIAKIKLGFVARTLSMPEPDSFDCQKWVRNDYMVVSWILNSTAKSLASSFIHTNMLRSDVLSPVTKSYYMLQQIETQKKLNDVVDLLPEFSALVVDLEASGHTIQECFKIISYLEWWSALKSKTHVKTNSGILGKSPMEFNGGAGSCFDGLDPAVDLKTKQDITYGIKSCDLYKFSSFNVFTEPSLVFLGGADASSLSKVLNVEEPNSYNEATDRLEWVKAMKDEIDALERNVAYVDDLLVVRNDPNFISGVKQALHYAFTIEDLGKIKYFLGIEAPKPITLFCDNVGAQHIAGNPCFMDKRSISGGSTTS
uniref:Uncharacterized protein n=1 Tax=Chenopodium quinoa TaxID=63459 RepID=A0A803N3Z5_CHEQI